ncbi:MAG: hypothetical protein WB760_31395 [Xanthobacteraceae bacterium]
MLRKMLRRVVTGRAADVRRTVVALIMLAALAAGFGTNPLAAQQSQAQPPSDAALQTLADQAIRRLDLQTELLRQPEPFGWRLNLPPEAVWFAVVVGVAVLFYAFRDMLPFLGMRRDGAWELDEAGVAESGPPEPSMALGAGDDLAAQGHFVEAMHVLLLQALAEIRRRLDEQFADSMTSREILRSRHLSDDLRGPLREVVNRVEWSYFGEHPAAKDDYLACRSNFGAIARVLHGSAPA